MPGDSPRKGHKKHKRRRSSERNNSPPNHINDGNFVESLSVNETNALREKLGLAPLTVTDNSTSNQVVDNQAHNYIHAPAKDLRKIKESNTIKDKLESLREKRRLLEKFGNEKLSEEGTEDTQSWIEKVREKERLKKEAADRAKQLLDIDEQSEVFQNTTPTIIKNGISYKPTDLSGLRVEHNVDKFSEGKSVILTLKDKDVLNEADGDVLVNVNMVDDEKADINRENLRKTAGLAGIVDQEDEDVLLGLRSKSILSKYDKEIDGLQKSQFIIGSGGSYSAENERLLKELELQLHGNKQSLPDTELRVTSEYYTEEELAAKFKKRKRRIRVARTVLTADDLLQDSVDEPMNLQDFGNRSQRRTETEHASTSVLPADDSLTILDSLQDDDPTTANFDEDWASTQLDEPDEFRKEVEKTITRVIHTKSQVPYKPEEVASRLISRNSAYESTSTSSDTNDVKNNKTVVFDSTEEFYKSIGIGFYESMRKNARFNEFAQGSDLMIKKEEQQDNHNPIRNNLKQDYSPTANEQDSDSGGSESKVSQPDSARRWNTVGDEPITANSHTTAPEPKSGNILKGVLEDEPRLDATVYSALRLAEKKGYVEKNQEKRTGAGTMVNLMAKHFVQEDIRYDDIDAKFSHRDRYSGPLSDFKELHHYKPDVKLEYVDELGRDLNAKEAFRQLSHKFHGKGSGKNKIQKRLEKIKEEFLLKASTSSDTPLGTAEKLNKKLKAMSLPYVILSGKNAAVKKLTK